MPAPATSNNSIRLFISYAHEDEILCKRLIAHLRSLTNEGLITLWSHSQIVAGELWDKEIQTQLTSAKVILLLVSSDFLASEYVNKVELPIATARHQRDEAWVIPVILRPCDWENTPLKDLQVLPKGGTPITTANNRDEALLNVVHGIRAAIQKLSDSEPLEAGKRGRPRVVERKSVTKPGILRHVLDRYLQSLHHFLTNLGTISKPPDTDILTKYLRDTRAAIENDIRLKTYIPLAGKEVSSAPLHDHAGPDPFQPPVQQSIRQILGREKGGDSASAQIAVIDRNSRVIRNLISTLLRSDDPLVLLGDPGTGKTMTLQQVALHLLISEEKRVFPKVTLYVRLGEFYVEGRVTSDDVWKYIKASVPPEISPYLEDLDNDGRLIVLFDGMDEMSRQRYGDHTEALSQFAGARKGKTRTLFSCRITDFSPKFIHRRLVLLPFNDSQIREYLRKYIPSFPLTIEGENWPLKQLVKQLLRGTLPLEVTNPFVLWLLCFQLQQKGSWPKSRVELLRYYIEKTYQRKSEALLDDGTVFPPLEQALAGWSKFAYTITTLNRGSAIGVQALASEVGADMEELIRVGKRCGVLQEALNEEERQIRFEHHRFQEFFTALYINQRQAEIAWLEKIDVPRWQETMVNVILMGGGENAIRTLAEAIESAIEKQRRSVERTESDSELAQRETVAADRVELASRVVRQAKVSSAPVQTMLAGTLQKAITFFAEHGTPITQVKMMRACQSIPEIDIFQVLRNSLKSPINWVRDQALIIISSSNRSQRAIGSHFASELGYDLANGMFPLRFFAYCKAATASKQIQNWLCLAAGTLAFLLNLSLLLTVAGLLFWIAWVILTDPLLSFSINPGIFVAAYALSMTAAIGVSLKVNPGRLWLAVIGIGTVSVALVLIIWNAKLEIAPPLLLLIPALFTVALVTLSFGVAIALAAQSLFLMAYLITAIPLRDSGVPRRSYFAAMWKNSWFDDGISVLGVLMLILLMTFVGCGALILVYKTATVVTGLVGLPFWLSISAIVFVVSLVVAIIVVLDSQEESSIGSALGCAVGVPLILAVSFLAFKGIDWLIASLSLPINVVQILTSLSAALPVIALLFMLWLFRRRLQDFFTWRSLTASRPISPADWKKLLTLSDPDQQQIMLNRTNYQSLGLNAYQFLVLLEEIEKTVTKEPALSTYWQKRDRLEQVLRQERHG